MTQADYRKTLTAARRDLEKLYRQREELERRIARLRQTIISLGALTKEGKDREHQKKMLRPDEKKESLTDAVLSVVAASDLPVSPKDIQRTLEGLGYDIGSTNPLASIWSVLSRLEQRPAFKPGKTAIRQYVLPDEDGRRFKLGFWWGDQNPPAPWVAYESATKKRKREEKANKAATNNPKEG